MVMEIDRRGFRDWFVQRVTAILIGIYFIVLMGFLLSFHPISFIKIHGLFSNMVMRVFTLIVLISILWHAWIGLWTVFTDYVTCKFFRLILQTAVCFLNLAYIIWALKFLWA